MRHPFTSLLYGAVVVPLVTLAPQLSGVGQDHRANIDALVRLHEAKDHFSGVVLVADHGRVLFEKAYGQANREWNVPNTTDTRFRIGSITKPFTAVLVMQLVQQKRVNLQGRLSDYLPYYRKDTGAKVTIHHLLTHTSGIPSYTSNPRLNEAVLDPYPVDAFITKYCSGDLAFEPGSRYEYNNSGYFLLGGVIEAVTGKSYEEVLKKSILEPAGMTNSGYDHPRQILPKRASGYSVDGDLFANAPAQNMSIPFAAGALYSTAQDLLLWDQALYSDTLLSGDMKDLMYTSHVPGENYGYGWFIARDTTTTPGMPVTVVSHGGSIASFNSLIVRRLEERVLIVILSNTYKANLGAMSKGITGILRGRPDDTGLVLQ